MTNSPGARLADSRGRTALGRADESPMADARTMTDDVYLREGVAAFLRAYRAR